jgi:hypothetical protein
MAQRKKPKIVYIHEDPEEEVEVEERVVQGKAPVPIEVSPSIRPPKTPLNIRRPSIILTSLFALIALTVLAAFIFIPPKAPQKVAPAPPKPQIPNCLGVFPDFDWGHPLHELECHSGALEVGQTLGDLLTMRGVDYRQVIQVMENATRQGLPNLAPGMNYHILYSPKNLQKPLIFVYEPGIASFVFMNLDGAPLVHHHRREVVGKQNRQLNVVIQTTLADAMYNRTSGLRLTRELEAAVKYKVDLFHLEAGDQFQMLFEETQYEGNLTEIGELLAVGYRQNGEQAWAFSYEDGFVKGFFDEEGRPMK